MEKIVLNHSMKLIQKGKISHEEYVVLQYLYGISKQNNWDSTFKLKVGINTIGDNTNLSPKSAYKVLASLDSKGIITGEDRVITINYLSRNQKVNKNNLLKDCSISSKDIPNTLLTKTEEVYGSELSFVESLLNWIDYKNGNISQSSLINSVNWLSSIEKPILSIEESIRKEYKHIWAVESEEKYDNSPISKVYSNMKGFISIDGNDIPVFKDNEGFYVDLDSGMKRISKQKFESNKI